MMASSQQSYFLAQQQQQQQQPVYTNSPVDQAAALGLSSHVSPSILLIIVILAVVFFVSGLLHLLVRFLLRPPSSSRRRDALSDRDGATALQGQLRQLFHLHDAGVDQTFIDALPVFLYKAVIGAAKSAHLDCAVCLCEFEPEDRLRLLPLCSHAFHADCIDTWLLSHSTCPLCRASLLSPATGVSIRKSPLLLVLESAAAAVENGRSSSDSAAPAETGPPAFPSAVCLDDRGESVVTVKLGKFKTVDTTTTGVGTSIASTSSDIGVDSRRCFSMGSFAYVVDESSELRVPIRTPAKKSSESKKAMKSVANPVFRTAISECDCESKREFEFGDLESAKVKPKPVVSESGEIGRCVGQSRRAFSFRFLRSHEGGDQDHQTVKGKAGKFPRRTVSEIGVARRENGCERGGMRFGGEEESDQSFNSLDSQSNQPSFARKTLLWLMGRQQNKVVHSSLDSPDNNV